MISKYSNLMEVVYKSLGKAGTLKEFRRAMMCRAEWVSRELIQVPESDERTNIALRGALAICFELADGAKDALENAKEEANSSSEQEILPKSL